MNIIIRSLKISLLLLTAFASTAQKAICSSNTSAVPPTATHLTPVRKKIALKVISELEKAEQTTSFLTDAPSLYGDRVDVLNDTTTPLIAKLPDSDMKTCMTLAVQTDQDIYTFVTETKTYPYWDMIQNKKSPKLIKKYNLPVSLQSSLPYGRLDPAKIKFVTDTLVQVAIGLRQRAESDIR